MYIYLLQYEKEPVTWAKQECWNSWSNFIGIFKAKILTKMTKSNSNTLKDPIKTRFYVIKVGEKSYSKWAEL